MRNQRVYIFAIVGVIKGGNETVNKNTRDHVLVLFCILGMYLCQSRPF